MTAEEATSIAERWLVECGQPHGQLHSATFFWWFGLERCERWFWAHGLREWHEAVRRGPVEDRRVLIEKWRVVFYKTDAEEGQPGRIAVDVDDHTGQVLTRDGR